MLSVQFCPVQPGSQPLQIKVSFPSFLHLPLFLQGFGVQISEKKIEIINQKKPLEHAEVTKSENMFF